MFLRSAMPCWKRMFLCLFLLFESFKQSPEVWLFRLNSAFLYSCRVIDVYTVYFWQNKIYFKGVIKAGLSLFSESENKFRRGENDLVAGLTIFGNWNWLKCFASWQFTFSTTASYQKDKENLNLNVPRCKVPAKYSPNTGDTVRIQKRVIVECMCEREKEYPTCTVSLRLWL